MGESKKVRNAVGVIALILIWIVVCMLLFFSPLKFGNIIKKEQLFFMQLVLGYILIFFIGNIAFSFTSFKVKDVCSILSHILFDENAEVSTYKKDIIIVKACQKANVYLGSIFVIVGWVATSNLEIRLEAIFNSVEASVVYLISISLINLCIFLPIELRLKAKVEKILNENEEENI